MASEQRKVQPISDEYTCQICECIFYIPMRLPCGHSFCKLCVEVHWELESTQTKFLCPQKKCGRKWEGKPTLRKDTTLEIPVKEAMDKLASEKLDEIQRAGKEGGAKDEGNASSPQSSPPAQGSGEEWSETRSKLVEIFSEWKTKRIEILKMLAGMIVQLKKRALDGNISKASGFTASIAGGIMLITGLALIPVTFGASLGLSIAGTVVGAAGGITAAAASIAVLVMNKALTKQATENIEMDKISGEKLAEVVKSIYLTVSEQDDVTMGTLVSKRVFAKGGTEPTGNGEQLVAATRGMFAAGSIGRIGANTFDDVVWAATRGMASSGMRIAGIVFSSVFLVIDVVCLIKTGVDMHKGNPSQTEAYWQEMYDILKLHLIGMAKINHYVERIKK